MRISEKQIQLLIYYLTLMTSSQGVSLSEDGIKNARNLLNEIGNQQSMEIKEIESKDKL